MAGSSRPHEKYCWYFVTMELEMPQAVAYYIEFSPEQEREINRSGWDSPLGRAYFAARAGNQEQALALGLFKKAARLNADTAEQVWRTLQNIDQPWQDNKSIFRMTLLPRSMDVGDLVVWDDGKVECVLGIGFKTLEGFDVGSLGKEAENAKA